MGYEVISRFFDRARGAYVDPGSPCPSLDAKTVARLVGAGCVVEVAEPAAAAKPRRGGKSARTKSTPTAPADNAEG